MPPLTDLTLRRKITLDLGGRRFVLVKKPGESIEHVLGKAAAAHLYREEYPELAIEIPVGDPYKPDVVALDGDGSPVFWAESGKVSRQKLTKLFRRYPVTHFVLLKFGRIPVGFRRLVERCLPQRFSGTVEILGLPADVADQLLDGTLRLDDCERQRVAANDLPLL